MQNATRHDDSTKRSTDCLGNGDQDISFDCVTLILLNFYSHLLVNSKKMQGLNKKWVHLSLAVCF